MLLRLLLLAASPLMLQAVLPMMPQMPVVTGVDPAILKKNPALATELQKCVSFVQESGCASYVCPSASPAEPSLGYECCCRPADKVGPELAAITTTGSAEAIAFFTSTTAPPTTSTQATTQPPTIQVQDSPGSDTTGLPPTEPPGFLPYVVTTGKQLPPTEGPGFLPSTAVPKTVLQTTMPLTQPTTGQQHTSKLSQTAFHSAKTSTLAAGSHVKPQLAQTSTLAAESHVNLQATTAALTTTQVAKVQALGNSAAVPTFGNKFSIGGTSKIRAAITRSIPFGRTFLVAGSCLLVIVGLTFAGFRNRRRWLRQSLVEVL